MRLTPNHRVVRRGRGNTSYSIRHASVLVPSDEIPTAASLRDFGLHSPDVSFAELCGWILTDGSYNQGQTVTIYQSGGRGKCEIIEHLLNATGTTYRTYRRQRLHRPEFSFSFAGPVAEFVRTHFPKKHGNFRVLNLWNKPALEALWRGMVEGDGNRRRDGRITFAGTQEKVDFFQALCAVLGKTCRVTFRDGRSWAAYVSHKRAVAMRGTNGVARTISREHYHGVVWCPQVEGSMWLARRNGKPFITGNTFPEELARRCILAGSSARGRCPNCGEPWVRVSARREAPGRISGNLERRIPEKDDPRGIPADDLGRGFPWSPTTAETVGWKPSCICPGAESFDPIPDRVLDPFGGSGTTAFVGTNLGREVTHIDLNPAYTKMAEERIGPMLCEVIET